MANERSKSAMVSSLPEVYLLSPEQAWHWMADLATQLAHLHAGDRWHGGIDRQSIQLDADGRPRLTVPNPEVDWTHHPGSALCPPELNAKSIGRLPTDRTAARKRLAELGISVDPCRIDVYQLGALACQLAAGCDVDTYLRSVKARARMPSRLRPIVDRCLGHDPSVRLASAEQVLSAIRAEDEASHASEAETPALGIVDPISRHTPSTGQPLLNVSEHGASGSAAPPEKLGQYRICERIGGGGMGDVYKAIDEGLNRTVAVKVLPVELARHPDFVRRFRAEATAIARLRHPNIVQVFACGEDAGRHYYVMQFVPGQSLAGLLGQRLKLGIDETLRIIGQCLSGLATAHHEGLVHRDIKPGNILLDAEQGQALVADFGLVKTTNGSENLTATGVIMGTVDYLSPEQARGLKVDCRSDLYSVGALAYRMLSGQLPFDSDTPTGMIFQHAFEQPKPLSDIAPEVPEALTGIVMRLLDKVPDNRYPSAESLLTALDDFQAGRPVVQPVISKPSGERPPSGGRQPAGNLDEQTAGHSRLPIVARRGWRTRFWTAFHAHAPAAVKELLDTQHQLDGAVLEYQQRRDRLAQLVHDTAEVVAEFQRQALEHRRAAAEAGAEAAAALGTPDADECSCRRTELERIADEFDAQLIGQKEQLHDLRLQLATVDATLGRLCSQRDALQARLATAQAELAGRRASSRRPSLGLRLALGAVAISVAVLVLALVQFPSKPRTAVRVEPVRQSADAQFQQVTENGLVVRSVRAAKILPIEDVYLGQVPEPLAGARAFTIPFDRRNNIDAEGLIEIELTRDQPLYLAVSWANDHLGEWMREAMLKPDFAPAGWQLVGELPALGSSGKRELRGLYWRLGKRGEVFRVRTRKAVAPMAIAPRPGAPMPTGDNLKATQSPPAWPGHDGAGFSSLAWLVDPLRDKANASWILDGDSVEFSAQKPRAYVSIPVAISGSYELSAAIRIMRAKETTALYLPVGDKAVVLDIRGDHGNSESPTATTRLLGLSPEPSPEQTPMVKVGTEYQYSADVAVNGENASIVVLRDGQPLFRWSGPQSAIADKNIRRGTIGLETAYYTVSHIRGLRLKTIAGAGKPIAGDYLKPFER